MTPTQNNRPTGNRTPPRPAAGAPHRPEQKNRVNKVRRDSYHRKEISLGEAIRLELRDRIKNFRLGFSIDLEDLVRGIICGLLLVINVLLQTTFFVRFAPFGAVPDVVLLLTVAMGASEGEKYGAITGLAGSFLLHCLGGAPGMDLSPLLYTFAGYFTGLLAKNYFSSTFAVKALYVGASCILRAIFSTITAAVILRASFSMIMTDVVIPEFFSTAVISPIIFFTVWLCFHRFHKSRAERTGS